MAVLRVLSVSAVLLTVISYSGCLAACTKLGWFGKGADCEYLCHCQKYIGCDQVTGACRVECNHGWMGPACQYESVKYVASQKWLNDNNDTTCGRINRGINSSAIVVFLDTPQPLTWIRIVFKHKIYTPAMYYENTTGHPHNFANMQMAEVDSRTADYSFRTDDAVNAIYILDESDLNICSLHINGGRNVALKQRTSQTSTEGTWYAKNAVDGLLGAVGVNVDLRQHCSHTSLNGPSKDTLGMWTLHLPRPVEVNKILIYNRQNPGVPNCCERRLIGFHLRLSHNSTQVFGYTDPNSDYLNVYTVVPPRRMKAAASLLEVQKSNRSDALALCEVMVHGEHICPDGMFGLYCDRPCNCRIPEDTSCFVSSGGCPSGCKPGYIGEDCWQECPATKYGVKCALNCSSTCVNNECDHVTGKCITCYTGYIGDLCTQVCPATKYGDKCALNCSSGCSDNKCNHVSGTCFTCRPGYFGDFCDKECLLGTYGFGCNKNCSSNCIAPDNSCDFATGECMNGCILGYQLPMCTLKCPPTKFGIGCLQTCSSDCPDRLCHHVTGECDQ